MRGFRWFVFSIVLVLVVAPNVGLADDSCARVDSRWGLGLSWVVVESGGTVFYGSGTTLIAVSASTDVESGRVDVGGVISEISILGNNAFIAGNKRGLVIVDISDLSHMQVLAHTDDPVYANGVDTNGDIAVVTDFYNDVRIFDVSSPNNPQRLTVFEVEGLAQDVVLLGQYAAIAEGTTGIRILDLSDPAHPVEVALLSTGGAVNRMTADGSTLYVADGRKGLVIVDVSDPGSPAILGSLALSGLASAVSIMGTTAWVAADYTGIFAVDVSDPKAPVTLGTNRPSRGIPVDVVADGSNVWFAAYNQGVARFEGADPSHPQEIGWYGGAGETRSVVALGDRALVADWSGLSLRVFDIDAEPDPVEVGSLVLPGYPRRMALASNRAYVAMEYEGLAVVDMANPENPILVTTLAVPGHPQDIVLMGDVAVVAAQSEGLQIIDITHPEAPSILASLEISGTANAVSIVGTTAFVAAGSEGLVVVDLSTPSNPQIISTLDTEGIAVETAPMGSYVVVSGYYSGLFVVDVSNLANPVQVGSVDVPNMARHAVISGSLAFVSNNVLGLSVVDLADPANPVVLGTTATPGTTWYGAFVGDNFVLADGPAGVVVFDVSTCGQGGNPPVADFSSSPEHPRAGDTVSFLDLSTGDPTSWTWSFSDDGSTSSEQNPTHVFPSAGGFDVRLEVSNADGTSTASRTLVIQPAEGELPPVDYPFAATAVIPAAAHAAGAQGTSWVTDVVLHNLRGEDVTADVFFLKSGIDGGQSQAVEVVVPGNESVLLADVVLETFGFHSASGAILIGSDQSLVVSSRTYNTAPEGTYGQFIPGFDVNRALISGQRATLIQLSEGDAFRANLGVANASAVAIDISAEIYEASGQHLGTSYFQVPPWSHAQINGVFSLAGFPQTADGYAVVGCDTAGAHWFAYASVVDNRSGDPVYVAPTRESSGPLWIVAAAHVQGANNTAWRTDLEIFDPAESLRDVSIEWLGSDGGTPLEVNLPSTGAPCRRVEDVLAGLFYGEGAGALRIEASQGSLAVTSRTYNDAGDATYGQYIPAVFESEALVWGRAARLVQLAHSTRPRYGFRTNLGFVNTTGNTLTMNVDLYDGDTTYLGNLSFELLPWQYLQFNNVFKGMADEDLDNAYAIVTTQTGGAAFFTYASVVDNRSGDPVFIPPVLEP